MNEPVRLSAGGNPLSKQLLRAGRSERPRDRAKAEAAAAVLLLATGHTGFFFSLKKAWLAWLLAGAGVLGAGAVATVMRVPVLHDTALEPSRAPALEVRPRTPSSFEPTRDHEARPVPHAKTALAPPSVARTVPSARIANMETPSELELLRRARMQIVQQDAAAALATLDLHGATFPRGARHEEAAALRIEALARSGDEGAARAAATRFAATYPESAYAERVRSIATLSPRP